MASDGSIKITTELDSARAERAMSKFSSIAKVGVKGIAIAVGTIGTALGVAAGFAIKTGIEFESAFAGVKKTVNATADELDTMRQGIRDMAKEIPLSASAIASVAEAAGQLGIKNQNIMSFTRVMSDLGVSTNMSATEAATALARLANITQMPQENFENLGSVVVALGNNLATTESEIVELGLRLAGAGDQVGMTEAQILGLAGAISSVGIEADAGGSAVSTVMTKMQLAVEQGGEGLEEFASVAGMTGEEFQRAFKEDAAGALVAFVTGLGKMDEQGKSAIATLDEMGITEIRQRDAMLRLSGAGDILSQSLGIATQAWSDNNALTNEASQRYETLESRLQLFKNNLSDFGITIYDKMRDPLKETVEVGIESVSRLQGAFESGGLKATVAEAGELFNEFADDIASTSDAAAGVVVPIKNIANAGASLAKSVLPPMAEGAKFLAKNFDILAPTVAASVVAFKGFKVVQSVTKWYKGASAASIAYSAAMVTQGVVANASSTAHLLLASTMSASELVVGVLTKRVTVATAAQVTWNAVLAANPIGVVVVAVAALTAGLIALAISTKGTSDESYKLSEKQKDVLKVADEVTEGLERQREAREGSVQSIDMEYDSYESLLGELRSITDENGRVKDGYVDRAAVITGQLADALGVEMALVDGAIQINGEYVGSMDEVAAAIQNVIVQKKAEALCSALQEDMANAYKESKAAMLAYKDAVAVAGQKQETLRDAQVKAKEAQDALTESGALSGDEYNKLKWAVDKANASVDEAQSSFDTASESVDKTRTTLNELSTEVNNYDALISAMAEGNAASIESAMNALLTGYQSYTAEMLAGSQTAQTDMLTQAKESISVLGVLLSEGGASYQAFGNEAAAAVANTVSNFNNLPGGIAAAIEKIGPDSAGAMVSALAQADLDGKLDEEGKAALESLITAFDGLEPGTKEVMSGAVEGAMMGLEGFDAIQTKAEDEGILFLDALRAVLEINSPSKKVQEIFKGVWEGAGLGLDEGGEALNTKGVETCNSFLDTLRNSGLGEAAQGIGQQIMSFFGIGVSSQAENSKLAGKSNTDAACQGAGSVDPTGTGSRFGSLLGGGIGGMIGLLFGKGKGNADSANSGAGSVDPTPTGGLFGTLYALAVGSKAGEAKTNGDSLASNAYTGSGSKSGYTPGSDFGSGFVNGIGAWLEKAASKAAELAIAAYNALKNALEEKSPSKKTKRSGKFFSQGFGYGIKENEDVAIKAAERLSEKTYDALSTEGIASKLQSIDIPETMARIYMAVDDKQSQVANNMIAAVSARENLAWKTSEKEPELHLSEKDMQRIGKEFGNTAAKLMTSEVKKLEIYVGERQAGRIVRRVSGK